MAELFDYVESQDDAAELVEEFAAGQVLTIVSADKRPADPAKPWNGSKYPATGPGEASDPSKLRITVPGVVVDYDEQQNPAEVARGSKQIIVAAKPVLAYAPSTDVKRWGVVYQGAKAWNVRSAKPFDPAGTPLFYIIEVGQ